MVVITLEKVPTSLRGELTRWMIEVSTGVFVGKLSALVRDLLWEKCSKNKRTGRCCQVYRTNTEQGFHIRMAGESDRSVIEVDGLFLVTVKNAAWERLYKESSENLDNLGGDIEAPNF